MSNEHESMRWCTYVGENGDFAKSEKVDAFLSEVVEVSKRHGFAIAHEDIGGAFIVSKYEDKLIRWLMDATDDTGAK